MNLSERRSLLDALNEPILLVDQSREIILANRAAQDLFGRQIEGLDFSRTIRHPSALQHLDRVLAGNTIGPEPNIVFQMSGPIPTTYKISVSQLENHTEPAPLVLISLTDISHILEAEQMRSDFVANVSHELRSPLTALTGFIETLKGAAKDDPKARARFLDIMEREASRMSRLISDLLSLSTLETNERIRPVSRANVPEIIARVIATLSPQAEAIGKTITFTAPDLSEADCTIIGDEDELIQLFHNLVENAIKYGRAKSEINISIKTDKNLTVSVKDQGEGIAPEHILRLTERFYRVDSGRSREKGGTGLGLAIVKHIINRHRGKLIVESVVGEGSNFIVQLPLINNDTP
ncbi:MAG: PAS domain-containing protein [Rhizobiaceae bacterium]|nr:PAS domain-containing protein [Rhizobiaceae bacterium]MBL4695613.1 PAS domain-containing protein [Rhizobiaceae bacterium]